MAVATFFLSPTAARDGRPRLLHCTACMRLHDYEQDSSGGNSHLAARRARTLPTAGCFFSFFFCLYTTLTSSEITTLAKLVTCAWEPSSFV